jgi:hypothetical protein
MTFLTTGAQWSARRSVPPEYHSHLYNGLMMRLAICLSVLLMIAAAASGQTPQPFPRPSTTPPPQASAPAQEAPPSQAPPPEAQPPSQMAIAPTDTGAPTEATLGFPIYPTARLIGSYDAGRAQRYYVFGTTAPFTALVAYYQTLLEERGNRVFEEPPTHMFEVGRFRDETMAFPPGVTIKDWTWGSEGYPNPGPDSEPARFPSIIMIVPAPPPVPE